MKQALKRLGGVLMAGALLLSAVPASADTRLPGDLNGDSAVNSFDQRLLLQAQGTTLAQGDLNADGAVDLTDADLLWKLTLGAISGEELPTTTAPSSTSATATTTSTTTASSGSKSSTKTKTTTTTTTTKKPTTTTTTTTTTKKPTTTGTTAPSGGAATAQARPTLAKVTSITAPTVKTSSVKDSAYTLKVKCSNGTVYDNTTQQNLQKLLAYIVKNEMGTAKFATYSTEGWKAQAVAAYTHLVHSCNNTVYTYGTKPLNLNDANDKKIYDAVGEVLGVKMLDSKGKTICAYYSGSAAGTSRNNQTGWELAYIKPVFSPETDALAKKYGYNTLYNTVSYSLDEIKSIVGSYLGHTILAESKSGSYPLYARTWSGAYVDKTNLYYENGSSKVYVTGRNLRDAFIKVKGSDILRSASFVVTGMSGNKMTISAMGHGHGMGMSQVGAVIFANEYGWNYRQILAHYFSYSSGTWEFYSMNW